MWTEERIVILERLWKDGCSAAVIARELGGLTRNAVIGKLHRLALSRGKKDRVAARPHAAKPAQAAQARLTRRCMPRWRRRRVRSTFSAKLGFAGTATESADKLLAALRREHSPAPGEGEDFPHRCGLLDLTRERCRFPIGDPQTPDFFFCGEARAPGLPYCARCALIAYRITPDMNLDGIPAE